MGQAMLKSTWAARWKLLFFFLFFHGNPTDTICFLTQAIHFGRKI